jgi:predicted SpoU family rRNA methylase
MSLKDFLKTYTAVSSKFIDEYYKFYEMCENTIFGINVENIIEYLKNTKKRKIL